LGIRQIDLNRPWRNVAILSRVHARGRSPGVDSVVARLIEPLAYAASSCDIAAPAKEMAASFTDFRLPGRGSRGEPVRGVPPRDDQQFDALPAA
jgi:hypothetical protein